MRERENSLLRKIAHSKYIDFVGVILVLAICIYNGFHETIYYQGGIQFGIPLLDFNDYISKGAFPIGLLAIIGAVFSLLAARMIVKQQNLGNLIGVFTTINSGVIDYLFGNHSAVITYPASCALTLFSIKFRTATSVTFINNITTTLITLYENNSFLKLSLNENLLISINCK